MSKEGDDVVENTCNVKRSELVPLECGRYMSDFLPQAPLALSLGAEESSICIHKRSQWAE